MTEAPAPHLPPRFEIAPHSGERLAYLAVDGRGDGPTLVWLGGFRSDMRGTKAEVLSTLCEREGLGFLRFDYSGWRSQKALWPKGCLMGSPTTIASPGRAAPAARAAAECRQSTTVTPRKRRKIITISVERATRHRSRTIVCAVPEAVNHPKTADAK